MSNLTPYDTGERLEPKPWHVQHRNLPDPEELDDDGEPDGHEVGLFDLKGWTIGQPLKRRT